MDFSNLITTNEQNNDDDLDFSNLISQSEEVGGTSKSGRWRVLDGDTVIDTKSGEEIRFPNVDTPEVAHPEHGKSRTELGGNEATQHTLDYINNLEDIHGDDIPLERRGTDAYGRTLGVIDGLREESVMRGHSAPERFTDEQSIEDAYTARRLATRNDEPIADPQEAFDAKERVRGTLRDNTPYSEEAVYDHNAFTASIARGTDNGQAMLFATANAFKGLAGGDTDTGWAHEGMARNIEEAAKNPANVASWDDVTWGNFGTYAAEAIGENLFNLATMAGTGGTLTAGMNLAGKQALGKAMMRFSLGSAAGSYGLSVGEVQMELKEAGIDASGTAIVAGIPMAALDAIGMYGMLAPAFGGVKKDLAESILQSTAGPLWKEALKGLGKGAAIGVASEAPTEAVQELIVLAARAYEDPTFNILSEENIHRIREAAIKGGIVGGAFAGPGGAYRGAKDQAAENQNVAFRERHPGEITEETSDHAISYMADVDAELDRAYPNGYEPTASEDPQNSNTNKEPAKDITAGVNAVKSGAKPAVYASDRSQLDEHTDDNYVIIGTADGGGYLTHKDNADAVHQHETNNERGLALGLGVATKPDPDGPEHGLAVIRVEDADGGVVQETVVNEQSDRTGYDEALRVASEMSKKIGGKVVHKAPNQVIEERSEQVSKEEEEIRNAGKPPEPPAPTQEAPSAQDVSATEETQTGTQATNATQEQAKAGHSTAKERIAAAKGHKAALKRINDAMYSGDGRGMLPDEYRELWGFEVVKIRGKDDAGVLKELQVKRNKIRRRQQAINKMEADNTSADPEISAKADGARATLQMIMEEAGDIVLIAQQRGLEIPAAEKVSKPTKAKANDEVKKEVRKEETKPEKKVEDPQSASSIAAPMLKKARDKLAETRKKREVKKPGKKSDELNRNDKRLDNERHRTWIQGMADELQENGGVQRIATEGVNDAESMDDLKARSSSTNQMLDWFGGFEIDDRPVTRKEVQAAVKSALANKRKLGKRQAKIIDYMLDYIDGATNAKQVTEQENLNLVEPEQSTKKESGFFPNETDRVVREPMNFAMAASENIWRRDTTTIDEIIAGNRTSTTRAHWKGGIPEVGDILEFFDQTGKEVRVRVTKVTNITPELKTNQEWRGQWSRKEGWRLKGNRYLNGQQVEFELLDKPKKEETPAPHTENSAPSAKNAPATFIPTNSNNPLSSEGVYQGNLALEEETTGVKLDTSTLEGKIKALSAKLVKLGYTAKQIKDNINKIRAAVHRAQTREEVADENDAIETAEMEIDPEYLAQLEDENAVDVEILNRSSGGGFARLASSSAKSVVNTIEQLFPELTITETESGYRVTGSMDIRPEFTIHSAQRTLELLMEVLASGANTQKNRLDVKSEKLGKNIRVNVISLRKLGEELARAANGELPPGQLAASVRRGMIEGLQFLDEIAGTGVVELPPGQPVWNQPGDVEGRSRYTWGDLKEIENEQAKGIADYEAAKKRAFELRSAYEKIRYKAIGRSGDRVTMNEVKAAYNAMNQAFAELKISKNDFFKEWGIYLGEGQFDNKDVVEEATGEVEEDARRFETEDTQNKRSLGYNQDYSLTDTTETSRGVVVESENKRLQKFGRVLSGLLKRLGMKDLEAGIIDSTETADLAAKYDKLVAKIQRDLSQLRNMKPTKEINTRIAAAEQDIAAAKATAESLRKPLNRGRIIYNDGFATPVLRRPLIIMDSNKKFNVGQQMDVLLHEFGHLIQRYYLDRMSPEVQQKMMEAFRNSPVYYKWMLDGTHKPESAAFQEWFAEEFSKYIGGRAALRDELGTWFGQVTATIKRFYDTLRGRYKEISSTYEEFVDAILGNAHGEYGRQVRAELDNLVHSPQLQERSDNASSDFTFIETRRFTRAAEAVNNFWQNERVTDSRKRVSDFTRWVHERATQSLTSWMHQFDSEDVQWIADRFHRRTDASANRVGKTGQFNHLVQQHQARVLGKFQAALERLSKEATWVDRALQQHPGLDTTSDLYQTVSQALVNEVTLDTIADPTAREIVRDLREGLSFAREYANEQFGLDIKERGNVAGSNEPATYWPIVVDMIQWESSKANILEALTGLQVGEVTLTEADALEIYEDTLNGRGTVIELIDGQVVGGDARAVAPGFEWARGRKWGPEVHNVLREYQVGDVEGVVHQYVAAMSRRGVTQKLFGTMETITNSNGQEEQRMDPLGKIRFHLDRAKRNGEITEEDYKRFNEVVIPALFGQLGIDGDHRWRKVTSGAIAYQNVRLLGLVVLSSFVDLSIIPARGGFATTGRAIRDMYTMDGSIEQGKEWLRALGAMRDDLTEHVANDQFANQFYGATAQKINEKFFRIVQMHRWTNMTRVMAVHTARRFVSEHAASNSDLSTQRLAEIGLTRNDVLRWENAGRPMGNVEHEAMNSAFNHFIDEAVLRPTSSLRPAWGSDPRWAMFWHLKSFMWAYYEQAIRRVWTESKREFGAREGAAKAMSAMPLVALAIPALALAAAGYEIRREIGWFGDEPEYMEKDGAEYISELFQRGGLLGPFQLILDAEENADRGKLAALSTLGPQMDQIQDLFTKPMDHNFWRAIPGLQQLPAARQWFNREVW